MMNGLTTLTFSSFCVLKWFSIKPISCLNKSISFLYSRISYWEDSIMSCNAFEFFVEFYLQRYVEYLPWRCQCRWQSCVVVNDRGFLSNLEVRKIIMLTVETYHSACLHRWHFKLILIKLNSSLINFRSIRTFSTHYTKSLASPLQPSTAKISHCQWNFHRRLQGHQRQTKSNFRKVLHLAPLKVYSLSYHNSIAIASLSRSLAKQSQLLATKNPRKSI